MATSESDPPQDEGERTRSAAATGPGLRWLILLVLAGGLLLLLLGDPAPGP